MPSLNRATLIGWAYKNPEIRLTNDGRSCANLIVTTDDIWVDKQSGEKKKKTERHTIVCFSPAINKHLELFVEKGALLYIEGALQTRKYTDAQGFERYSTEIVASKIDSLSKSKNGNVINE